MRIVIPVTPIVIILSIICGGFCRIPKKIITNKELEKVRLDKDGFEKTQTIHYNWYLHSIKALMGQLGKDLMKKLSRGNRKSLYKCLDKIEDKRDIVTAARCLTDARNKHIEDQEKRKNQKTYKTMSYFAQKHHKKKFSYGKTQKISNKKQFLSIFAKYLPNSRKEDRTPLKWSKQGIWNKKRAQSSNANFLRKPKKVEFSHGRTKSITRRPRKRLPLRKIEKSSEKRKSQGKPSMKAHLMKLYQKQVALLRSKENRKRSKYFDKMEKFYPNGKKSNYNDRKSSSYSKFGKSFPQMQKRRYRRSPHRLIADLVSKSDSNSYMVKNLQKAPYLKSVGKTAVQKVTNLIKTFIHGKNATQEQLSGKLWTESYKNILKIKRAMDKRAAEPGAKVYEMRMLDLVMNRKNPTKGKHEKSMFPPLVNDALKLLKVIDRSPKQVGHSSNFKFLSPRFASVMPAKAAVRGKLSPSILPFYKDDTEDQILPVPKLLEATGLKDRDREEVLETIMELSGARQTVDDAMKVLSSMNLFGMEGELTEVTKRISENFKNLEKSFNSRQKGEMRRRGFTFMETNQIQELHQKQGMTAQTKFDLNSYGNQTLEEREESLWLKIYEIARNSTEKHSVRDKRQITLLSVLNPVVLDPYMFAPIYGLTVLGPTVLSPSIFSPLILNPAVLSPYVLSPAVGMPFILSPYVLSPYVLSPLVMAPFILTPYVLSPNVINPYVLSPLILSPLVLCPDLVSPMVLGGAILSPGVASPSVLSKSYLMASVLSPSVLS